MDNRFRQIIKLITISWLPKAREDSTRATSKLKVMRTLLEFHLEWQSLRIDAKIQRISMMKMKRMTLITTSWPNQNYSRVTPNKTTCTAISLIWLCGSSMVGETLDVWVLMLQPCTRQDRRNKEDRATQTLKMMVKSRRMFSSNGNELAVIDHPSLATSLKSTSPQTKATIWSVATASSKTICTMVVARLKSGRISHRRRPSSQLCICEAAFTLSVDMMLMTRCSLMYVNTMTWSRIDGTTHLSRDQMVPLSSNYINRDRRAAAACSRTQWFTSLADIVATLVP